MPRRANHYQQQYELPHNYHRTNNKNDPIHNNCRVYVADPCYDNDNQYQNVENLIVNQSTIRAPVLLPPIERSNR